MCIFDRRRAFVFLRYITLRDRTARYGTAYAGGELVIFFFSFHENLFYRAPASGCPTTASARTRCITAAQHSRTDRSVTDN